MSNIEWTGLTWNPIAGCSKVSAGCANCYAEPQAYRNALMGQTKYQGLTVLQGSHARWTGKVNFDEAALVKPLHRKMPTTYFVNSMSDLFHEAVTDEQIDRIFAVMALCPQHTFQVLTKRPDRMNAWFDRQRPEYWSKHILNPAAWYVWRAATRIQSEAKTPIPTVFRWTEHADVDSVAPWPLRNVWLGVTTEDQKSADERIPLLLDTPAAIRFISAEPLLGELDLERSLGGTRWIGGQRGCDGEHHGRGTPDCPRHLHHHHDDRCRPGLDWVIVGGESGSGSRACELKWLRQVVDQCHLAAVPVFVKQLGAKPVDRGERLRSAGSGIPRATKWNNPALWPIGLQVREMPAYPRSEVKRG